MSFDRWGFDHRQQNLNSMRKLGVMRQIFLIFLITNTAVRHLNGTLYVQI